MPIRTPSQLVEEYKRSGEYDRLRRKILEDFENGSSAPAFLEKVEEIARKRVATDYRVKSMAPEMAHKELMQEIARFTFVERAVEDLPALTDPATSESIRSSLKKFLGEGDHDPDTATSSSRREPNSLPPKPSVVSESSRNGRTTPEMAPASEPMDRAADRPTTIRMPSGPVLLAHPLPAKPVTTMIPSGRSQRSRTPSTPAARNASPAAIYAQPEETPDVAVFSMPMDDVESPKPAEREVSPEPEPEPLEDETAADEEEGMDIDRASPGEGGDSLPPPAANLGADLQEAADAVLADEVADTHDDAGRSDAHSMDVDERELDQPRSVAPAEKPDTDITADSAIQIESTVQFEPPVALGDVVGTPTDPTEVQQSSVRNAEITSSGEVNVSAATDVGHSDAISTTVTPEAQHPDDPVGESATAVAPAPAEVVTSSNIMSTTAARQTDVPSVEVTSPGGAASAIDSEAEHGDPPPAITNST